MPRYIAFLRAINVGGHTVPMERLRELFTGLRFNAVETFIASGNVIFESPSTDAAGLQQKIEAHLFKSLGYEVKTFIRTDAEIAAIARYRPFTEAQRQSAATLCVAFIAEPLTAAARKSLMSLRTGIDDFEVRGREVYWLCKKRQGESTFSNVRFEKTVSVRATFRGVSTIAKLASRYSARTGGT